MTTRYYVASVGAFLLLLGLAFEAVAVSTFATWVLLIGAVLLALGMRVELYSLAAVAIRAIGKCLENRKAARQSRQAQRSEVSPTHSDSASRPRDARPPTPTHWPARGDYAFEVVGEAHYQDALARAAGNKPAGFEGKRCIAQLVPEDDNRYDKSAVAVCVNGSRVGYLSRDDARSFRRRLGSSGLTGTVTTCDAVIRGGGVKTDGSPLFYGIWLDIKQFG